MFEWLTGKLREAFKKRTDAEASRKLRQDEFNFEDFLTQMQQMRKLGPLEHLFKLIPGVKRAIENADFAAGEKEMMRFEAIVHSMTVQERRRPEIINGPRRKRIAVGAAVPVSEVNSVLIRFDQMRAMMQELDSGNFPKMPPLP